MIILGVRKRHYRLLISYHIVYGFYLSIFKSISVIVLLSKGLENQYP